jgi:hypothetical protein
MAQSAPLLPRALPACSLAVLRYCEAAHRNGVTLRLIEPGKPNYLRAEARKDPQPEIHLRADRRVRYDFVAKVLASASAIR